MDTGSSYTIIETDDESEMLVKENIDKKRWEWLFLLKYMNAGSLNDRHLKILIVVQLNIGFLDQILILMTSKVRTNFTYHKFLLVTSRGKRYL